MNMKLGIDLDKVLFDTDKLKQLIERHGFVSAERSPELFEQLREREPSLDLKSFVYEDVWPFLEQHGSMIEVITSYHSRHEENDGAQDEAYRGFQQYKLDYSGIAERVAAHHLTAAEKAATLAECQSAAAAAGEAFYFLDDTDEHLAEAHELGIRCAKMVRPSYGLFGFERTPAISEFPVVHSLQEFFELCQSWEQEVEPKHE